MHKESVVIHPALVRPVLLAGAERIITICWMGFCACVIAAAIPAGLVSWRFGISLAAVIILWIVGMGFFRNFAKYDAQGFGIYWRHIKYRAFYPATAKLRHCSKTQMLQMIGFK